MSETLQNTLPSYLYQEYSDDSDLQAFVTAYNQLTQQYINTFNQLNLPIYTGANISGPLLDWVGEGIYGYFRPTLIGSPGTYQGPLNTYMLNTLELNQAIITIGNTFQINDDIYKRLLTWHFYKGDGKVFNIKWFKRRIKRFLIGANGTAPNIDNTYDISVTFSSQRNVIIQLPAGPIATVLLFSILSGVAETPFQFFYTFSFPTSLLYNNSGVLCLSSSAGWATTEPGTSATFWSNGGVVSSTLGAVYNGHAPIYYGTVSSTDLLSLGPNVLPQTQPAPGSLQLWLNVLGSEAEVWIA